MYTIHINQSTNKVYGRNVNKVPIVKKETRYEYEYYTDQIKRGIPGDFLAPYGVSKHAADLYIQDHYSYGLRLGAFR
jgi:nucleoside-diphosphate-sugar epimerase